MASTLTAARDIDSLTRQIVEATNVVSFDLTGDGTVDTTDLDHFRADAAAQNGLTAPYPEGDSNLDGAVNATDLDRVRRQWQDNRPLWSIGVASCVYLGRKRPSAVPCRGARHRKIQKWATVTPSPWQ